MQLLQRFAKRKYPWIDVPMEWAEIVQVLEDYRPKQHYLVVKWEIPAQGMIKCNTDGVSRGNLGNSAYGFYPRDDRGVLLYGQADAAGIKTNLQAKIKTVTKAVTYCKTYKIRGITIETDSIVVMKMIKKEWQIPWHVGEQIQHIQYIMQEMEIQIRHVFREANQLADALTNEACEQQSRLIIQAASQLPIACKGIARLDKL